MYAEITRFRIDPNTSTEAISSMIENFAPQLIEKVPGLLAYYVLEAGDGILATVIICEGPEDLEECAKLATEWGKQRLSEDILSRENLSGFFVEIGEPLQGPLHAAMLEPPEPQFVQYEEGKELADQKVSIAPDNNQGVRSLLSVEEVSEMIGMGKSWVYQHIRSGEIPSMKLGGAIKVKREELEEYVEAQRALQSKGEDLPSAESST
jgi:excisionase family DNA binding protein